ncbi:PEP-CTERM sorting domain-containing protein [Aeoliella mucimassa]|uniref:PEP-CTERM motif protein n=1 Tax=Aeoliella mucimassa TaxID=2527972 RepID=A0A518AQ32_9BACT|nr:PEP-CTERM sorting domain-containing protein [Aeoliella mucimassa]QDU56826.1 PEP-CTERM motif protein [Aeoliella mucimassa]
MKVVWSLALVACLGLTMQTASALEGFLSPSDSILAIDTDGYQPNSSFPAGEAPAKAIDGTLNKYLNFAKLGTGFIVTPAGGSSVVQSLQLTTANDAEARDPSSFELWGTNDAIVSAENSAGLDESWSLISSGALSLPSDRDTLAPLVDFSNGDAYTSYKLLFPTIKDPGATNSMQVAEVSFYTDTLGTSADVLNDGDAIIAVGQSWDSDYPNLESPAMILDGDSSTKYLNFGLENTGFIVTPAAGPMALQTFQITTANDAEERDPVGWEVYGTNDPITSADNSDGVAEAWELIDSGAMELPVDRLKKGPFVIVDNDTAYASYKMVFPTLKNAGATNSMQIADIQFYNQAVPEPSTLALTALGAALALVVARRR